jgi:hypothetical protein
VGRIPRPFRGIVDSQSAKTIKKSARISGYDAHKNVKGRKRHLLVDMLGLPLSVYVTPADGRTGPGRSTPLAGRPQAASTRSEEDLGGWGLRRRKAREVVPGSRRMGARGRRAR